MRHEINDARITLNEYETGYTVIAYDKDGRQFDLIGAAFSYIRAEKLAAKVKERGSIDPDLWSYYAPYGTNAWLLDGHEERQLEDERFGYC